MSRPQDIYDRFDSREDPPDTETVNPARKIEKELERNGSISYVVFDDGSSDWVDARDVDGWRC